MGLWLPYALLYIGKPRGKIVTQKPQSALGISLSKREYAIWECHVEHHGAPPPWPATLGGGGPPHEGPCPPSPSRRPFWNFQKGSFPKISKSAFTIHDDIFQRPNELKIFMWVRTMPVPTKIIFN